LRLRRFRRFSFPCEQDCRDIRPIGGGPPPSADQRVSTGSGIGSHRDKTQFDGVVGVSLLAPCVLRFRRKAAETWDRVSLVVELCSAYLLSGPLVPFRSTAFPRSISFAIQSRCGRSLRRRLLVRRARTGSGSVPLSLLSFCSSRKSHRLSDRTALARMPVVTDAQRVNSLRLEENVTRTPARAPAVRSMATPRRPPQ
jgi:hypothetical protein